MPAAGTSRRSFFALMAGAVAAPYVVRSGVLMPVKAPIILPTFVPDYPVRVVPLGQVLARNPAFVAAHFFAGMGFPIDVREARKLARLCAEPVPACDLAAVTANSAGVA